MVTTNQWWLIFASALIATALVETLLPFRTFSSSSVKRWASNSILLVVSSAVVVCAYELTGIALAFEVKAGKFGIFNRIPLSYFLSFAIGFAALDLSAYLGHRLYHAVGFLWKVHQVHHTETDLDLTTGFRFHPVEALITEGLRLITIALLGVPPFAVVCYGLGVVFQNFLSHANLRFPEIADRPLRWLMITPPMHRAHHSVGFADQNTNFGTIFSVWDRMFRTYLPPQAVGAEPLRYGLTEVQEGSSLSALGLLALPFRRTPK